MTWRADGPQGNETGKIHDRIAPYVSGRGLDLGCGWWKLKVPKISPGDFCLGVDGAYHGMAPDVDIHCDVTNLDLFADESFDYVYSSHTLEDMPYPGVVLKEWWRLIKPDGRLILYLPLAKAVAKELGLANWENFYPNRGEPHANPHHEHDYSPQEIEVLVAACGPVEVLLSEVRGEGDEYSFLQVFRKLGTANSPKVVVRQPAKRALVVRYGAIGDIIQATPVFRQLKREGYHVTLNCTNYAKDILKHNPNVDEFMVQVKEYVENKGENLNNYWKAVGKGYDRFVNLTGSAEESLLTADKWVYKWSTDIRNKHPELDEASVLHNALEHCRKKAGDTNYYDQHLRYGGYDPTTMPIEDRRGELFFSDQEALMAHAFRARYANRFVILWSLAGSSYHKIYPYFHLVLTELTAKNPDVLIVSVGDSECRLLERAPSTRYFPRSGIWELRTSMLMTKWVDLVVGPETGILNAAGCFDTPKITLLSHSKHENLCSLWENDYCLAPQGAFCYPCHTLHYTHVVGPDKCGACDGGVHDSTPNGELPHEGRFNGFWSCPHTKVAVAGDREFPLCTAIGISPKRLLDRINEVYTQWKERHARRDQPRAVEVGASQAG